MNSKAGSTATTPTQTIAEKLNDIEAEIREEIPEEKPKRKRGRPKGSTKKKIPERVPERSDLKPFFITLNLVLKAVKIRELSEAEIDSGCEAWFPVYEKYYPQIGEKSIWIPPLVWCSGVIGGRLDEIKARKKPEKSKDEK